MRNAPDVPERAHADSREQAPAKQGIGDATLEIVDRFCKIERLLSNQIFQPEIISRAEDDQL